MMIIRLLGKADSELQKQALRCLLTWQEPHVSLYKEHLERIIDEKTFRSELVSFPLDPETSPIQESHRALLLPILLPILLVKMTSRKGRSARVILSFVFSYILTFDLLQYIYTKNSPTARRKTIMAYLAGLSGKKEVGLLVDQLTTGFPEDGVEGLSLAKLTGFIRLSEHIYASMPSGVVPHVHRLISLTIHILRHALSQISANRPAPSGGAYVEAPITVALTASPEHVPMEISEPGSTGEHPTASGKRKRKAAASPPASRGKRRKEESKPTSPPEEVPAIDDEIPEEEQEEEVIGGAPSKEAGYSTSQWVDLRNHCIRRIGEAVAGIDEIEWVKYLPDFLDLIGPMVPRLSADCRSGPSAVMEALLSIACQVPTVPLLAERGFLEPMFACLSLPNGVPSLVLPLLDVIEGLISMAQDTPPVDLLTPLASHLLSHLLPGSLSAKRQLRFCYPLSMNGNMLTQGFGDVFPPSPSCFLGL